MYRKDNEGWLKHTDFIVLDMIFLQVAFVLAYAVSGYGFNPYATILYRNMALFLELADLIVLVSFGTLNDILISGFYIVFSTTAFNHSGSIGNSVSVSFTGRTTVFQTCIDAYCHYLHIDYVCCQRTLEETSEKENGKRRWREIIIDCYDIHSCRAGSRFYERTQLCQI